MMINWMKTLLNYNFDVVSVPSILNILSDKLSRIFQTTMELEKFTDKGYIIPDEKDRKNILDEAHKFGHFDAVKYVNQRPTCQKYNVYKRGYSPQKPVYSYMPGDSYAMGLAGLFKSNAGFVILESSVDKTAKCVAMALIKIFSLMGYSRHFTISDNGTEIARA
ncbi:hypothetical protein CU097_001478 [Rhizopus azygosporus]|uniref:Uncharacterized protein n=1 Tax=Rhizopus azygosporus TaxID=86630 RepID=A0A367J2B6_RHIAZ|nr:hypothetical protein CU097_001478 [Rhizopus azygosporus]